MNDFVIVSQSLVIGTSPLVPWLCGAVRLGEPVCTQTGNQTLSLFIITASF